MTDAYDLKETSVGQKITDYLYRVKLYQIE